ETVTQIEIQTSQGQTFVETLRSVLRQDPDVVLIGEIRDGETAEAACQAAHTGHLVFSTLHANDSIAAVLRMLELGTDPSLLGETLSLVLAQRLVRRLCPECKEEYQPKPKELENSGLPAEEGTVLFREGTNDKCQICQGTGYFGQVGVFEVLPLDDAIRAHIEQKPTSTSLRLLARNHGLLTLQEEGLRLVARGITSMDELKRVVG
ncbi:MAG: Flp pilus assembly complex ATPase component TadA, partial [Planctomycetaceae bacterium]|nr:Flp pilus assembly complex ATPase component TadA [Planctomycetaceae bacterium]